MTSWALITGSTDEASYASVSQFAIKFVNLLTFNVVRVLIFFFQTEVIQ